ncbi:hypothetical protein TRFO_22882 [Tritrichomonas foetus]|uniref:PAS domain-containing protein n=1 Tax=Tritrichomonas foetus TaxID=1144522 RepID=A0A1J4KC48_9EUKA|nr:hypothetical protein TRFO_22882 [Tritrichomonas foetus]|eukprot:OHT08546.1 hypothetical protein TRFO_22882 [Tritrichomonas foetus]
MKKLDQLSLSTESQKEFDKTLKKITHTSKSNLNSAFPFFVHFSTLINAPSYLYLIPMIYLYAQSILISMWLSFRKKISSQFIILYNIFFFYDFSSTQIELTCSAISVLTMILCVIITYAIVMLYIKGVDIPDWLCYLIGFFNILLLPILLPVVFMVLGRSLSVILENFHIEFLVIAILALFGGIAAIIVIYIFTNRTSKTMFITQNPCAMWETKTYLYVLYSESAFIVAGSVFQNFKIAILYVIIIFHAIIAGIGLFFMTKNEKIHPFGNATSFGFEAATIIADLMYFAPMNFYIMFLVPLAAGIIISTIYYFVNKKLISKILEREPKNDEELVKQCRIAFSTGYDRFLKGDMMEKALSNSTDNKIKLKLLHLCCFFPRFDPLTIPLSEQLNSAANYSQAETYLLYTINYAIQTRQILMITDEMADLRVNTGKLTQAYRTFWLNALEKNHPKNGFDAFHSISILSNKINKEWCDMTTIYPSNTVIAQSYAHHLIENEGMYEDSTLWIYRSTMLNSGHVFNLSSIEISLLQTFPCYINEITKGMKVASFDDLDFKRREELLTSLIKSSKPRLELERSLKGKSSPATLHVLLTNVCRTIAVLLIWIVVLIYFTGSLNTRVVHFEYMSNFTTLQSSISLTQTALFLHAGVQNNNMYTDPNDFFTLINADNETIDSGVYNFSMSHLENGYKFFTRGHEALHYITDSMVNMITSRTPMTNVIDKLHAADLTSTIIQNQIPINTMTTSVREAIVMYFTFAQEIIYSESPNIISLDRFTVIGVLQTVIEDRLRETSFALTNDLSAYDQNDVKIYRVIFCVLALVALLVCIPATIIETIFFHKELNHVMKLCYGMSDSTKHSASENIIQSNERENEDFKRAIHQKKNLSKFAAFIPLIINIVVDVIIAFLLFAFTFPIQGAYNRMSELGNLLHESSQRCTYLSQCVSYATAGPQINQKQISYYVNLLTKALGELGPIHSNVLKFKYSSKFPTTSKIQALVATPKCTTNNNSTDLHSRYVCQSLDQQLITFLELGRRAAISLSTKFAKSEDYLEILHLGYYHLYNPMREVIELLIDYGQDISNDFDNQARIYAIVSMIITIISFILDYLSYKMYIRIYRIAIKLILRLDPVEIIDNKEMVSYLLGKNKTKTETGSSAFKIINVSPHPILIINGNEVVISINSTFQSAFGLDPANIIGTPIDTFIKDDESVKWIREKVKAKAHHESVVLNIKKTNGSVSTIEITIVNLTDEGDEAYALVITDKLNINKIKSKAEELRKDNDIIINNLYPSILKEEPTLNYDDIAFILIKFSEFSLNTAPADISKEFFDLWTMIGERLKEYPNITKLYINDCVFCGISRNPESTDENENALSAFKFVMNCFEHFSEILLPGALSASIESGKNAKIHLIGNKKKNVVISCPEYDTAFKLLQIGQVGKLTVGPCAFPALRSMNYQVEEKRSDFIRKYYSFSPETSDT